MSKLCLLLNPKAGRARKKGVLDQIQAFAKSRHGVDLTLTTGSGDAERLARRAADANYDVLAVAGGDGTVNEVINGLMTGVQTDRKRPQLGIIPIGSANDLARGLAIGDDLDESFTRILRGHSRAIDIGSIDDGVGHRRYFGFSAGIGYVGAVAAERFRIRHVGGPWLYLWAGVRALFYYEARAPFQVGIDGQCPTSRRLLFLSINNVGSVGTFPLTPAAQVDDGLFDVLSVRYVSWARRPRLLLLAWLGRHLNTPEFELVRCNRLEVGSAERFPVHVDGEIYDGHFSDQSQLVIELLPRALSVLG